jgi:hypothetical protein
MLCGAVAGNLDNLLRPRLVGKDTEMHDLFVLFGTLGGISMFGVLGIIIGPIVAALFITIWEIYGKAFEAYLPDVGPLFSQPTAAGAPPEFLPEEDSAPKDSPDGDQHPQPPSDNQQQESGDNTGKTG